MNLKISSWAQLILWIVFLLNGIGSIVGSNSDRWGYTLSMAISLAGIFISALITLTVRSITYQPSYKEMTAFDRNLKFTAVAGWGVFFVLLPLVLVVLGEDCFWILPLFWMAYTILCDVLLIISKVKEKKRQTNA